MRPAPAGRPSTRPLRLHEADAIGPSSLPTKRSTWLYPLVAVLALAAAVAAGLVLRGH